MGFNMRVRYQGDNLVIEFQLVVWEVLWWILMEVKDYGICQLPQRLTLILVWMLCGGGDVNFDGVCVGFEDEYDMNVA